MKREVAGTETKGPQLTDLRAFCFVCDLGSLTAAARSLGETKGSISRRLTRLEQAVGVRLLRRSARLVEPTEEGRAYRQRIGRAIELIDEAQSVAHDARARPHGLIRITAPPDLANGLLAPRLAEFSLAYPAVSFEIVATERVLDLAKERIDLALRVADRLPDSSLVAHRVGNLETILVASPGYLADAPTLREPADLARHRLLWMHSAQREHTLSLRRDRPTRAAEVKFRAPVAASDLGFTRIVALAGGGIALQPRVLVDGDIAAGTLRRVLTNWYVPGPKLHLVHGSGRLLPARVRAFRDWLLERLADGPLGTAGSPASDHQGASA